MFERLTLAGMGLLVGGAALALAGAPGWAQAPGNGITYRNEIGNDMRQCAADAGPAVRVTVNGVKAGGGTIRVQSYRGIRSDWLEKGKWLSRIEVPARAGSMTFCMPVPRAGTYGIAVRHDANGNGKTDITKDGGGMSNNPSINILNLGKPSYTKTAFEVGPGVTAITITMKYM
ncbi:MAG: DUF2141 domain-containing protein [Erythrobacter sp.]